jgi:hypothetical protein
MIKHLFCISLLVSSLANAEGIIAEGKTPHSTIALTDTPCFSYPGSKIAYDYKSNGRTIMGCWVSNDSKVVVSWNDMRLSTYSFNFFNTEEIK